MSFCSRWNLKGNKKKAKLKIDLLNQWPSDRYKLFWLKPQKADLGGTHWKTIFDTVRMKQSFCDERLS